MELIKIFEISKRLKYIKKILLGISTHFDITMVFEIPKFNWSYFCRQILPPPPPIRKFTDESCGPAQYSEVPTAAHSDTVVGRATNDHLSTRSGKVKVKQTTPPTNDLSSRPFSKKYNPSPPSSSRSRKSPGSSARVKDHFASARGTPSQSESETGQEVESWEKRTPKTVTEQEIVREMTLLNIFSYCN